MLLFENENFLAVDKPHAVLTTPARDKADPRPCLGLALQKQLGQQIYPVHRLDFEVAGLVLFAKNPAAHRLAQAWFEHTQIIKLYEAFSDRLPPALPEWEEWHAKLVRGKKRSFEAPHGKPSTTRARVVERGGRTLWELQPVTGRPHQLRVQMAQNGFPIRGDKLYGAPETPHKGIALKAVHLDFSKVGERMGLPEHLSAPELVWP
jgi:tRNA pseudouridine32 synthase/23S rRNA pseudouridine746 synthase